ncbi:MAG TPA: helix-turn-helix transcriptional regulator [Actinophytocola sp.]|nr:helix-turn-helix transcriptional regulator [Actinophytocola sp.]
MAVGTTRGKRRLGRYLTPFLERSGLKIDQVARQARCSRQTVSRLFAGDHLPRFYLFTTLIAIIDVTGAERERALELWEIAEATSVTIEHASDLPTTYMRFRMDEGEAETERTLDTVIVPGLLQTPAYAEALSLANRPRWKGAWDAEIGVAERRDRQALLHREERPLHLHALLDEVTLRRMVGGPKVMAEQIEHLIEMSKRPNVTIQIIPLTAGAYSPMTGPLYLLAFPEEDEPHAAYVESLTGMATVDNEEDVATLSAVWDAAAAAALPADKSARTIRKARTTL